ncbi:MAG: hypothetical protein IT462_14850 [Planctomycetes bacterium]|nr:hypothetical protein [Planctomycetota bacterium]
MKLAAIALVLCFASALAAQVEFRDDFTKASQEAVKANRRLFIYFAPTLKAPAPDKPAPEDPFKPLWADKTFADRLARQYIAAKLDVTANQGAAARYGPVWAPMFVVLGEDQQEIATIYELSAKADGAIKWLDSVDAYVRALPLQKDRAAREPANLRAQNDLASLHAEHAQYGKAAAVYQAFLKAATDKADIAAAKCQFATVLAAEMEIGPVREERNVAAFKYYRESVEEFIALKDKRALDAAAMSAALDDTGNKGEALRALLFKAADAFPADDYEGEVRIKAAIVAARYEKYDTARKELKEMLDKPKYAKLKQDIVNVITMIELWARKK